MPDSLMPQASKLTANEVQALNNLYARSISKTAAKAFLHIKNYVYLDWVYEVTVFMSLYLNDKLNLMFIS